MTLPRFHTQIERMIENTALQTKTARAIVRKAGIHQVASGAVVIATVPTTILDMYIDPRLDSKNWQWGVDLTGYTQIRMVCEAGTLYLMYSVAGVDSSALDPGDYAPFDTPFPGQGYPYAQIQANATESAIGEDLKWGQVTEDKRRPLRLSISSVEGEWRIAPNEFSEDQQQGFSVAVQVI